MFVSIETYSQTKPDSTAPPWKQSLVAGLNLTQVSYTNWQGGGQNALAYSTLANGRSTYNDTSLNWDNVYDFAFGQTRLGDQGLRKTDDKIDISSTLTYKVGTFLNPYANATLKTQFAKGFTYDAFGNGMEVSKFFDPGYLTQTAGVGYQPLTEVKLRLGTGFREIITSAFTVYASDPPPAPQQKTRVDGGIEFDSDIAWNLAANLQLVSSFQFFAPYTTLDQIVVRGDNTLTAKVSKYIVVSLDVQLINEKRVTPDTQYKQSLAMGLSYTVF
jgi:hypothetical protein